MALPHNPHITEAQLAALHEQFYKWALFCTDFDPELAKETLQQAYLKVIEGKAVFRKESLLKTWMFSLIRITSFELQRKVKPPSNTKDVEELLDESEEYPDQGTNLGYLYSVSDIEKALKQLPLLQREILFLAFYYDNSLSEIAKILAVGIGTVRSEYHNAKVKMKLLLCAEQEKEVRYEEKYS